MEKTSGKYELSAEGEAALRGLCAELKVISEANHEEARRRLAAGDAKGAVESAYAGLGAEADALRFGCSWASEPRA